ncbi:MAG: hypothetical protein ABXS91_08565 [Sulfurimonas sp.]
MASFPKDEVAIALTKKWTKSEIADLAKNKNLSPVAYAMLFSHLSYSRDLVVTKITSLLGRTKKSVTRSVDAFMKKCEDNGIVIAEIVQEQPEPEPKKKRPKKAKKGEVEKAVSKLSPVLDLFNVNKRNTIDLINSIEGGENFSQEAILASYKVLYTLLMAKAKGETVTKKVSAQYEMEEQPDGTFKKVLMQDRSGKRKIWEETQSHLPDEKAFAGALVVMEVIQNLENGNQEYLTQEEKEDRYALYLKRIEEERTNYSTKEYTDAEIMEEED